MTLAALWLSTLAFAVTVPALADTTPAESSLKLPDVTTGVSTGASASKGSSTGGPGLEIPFPTVKFTDIVVNDAGEFKIIDVPWIAQYISGLYKYMVAVAAVVASLVLVIGGFLWLTSGGDAARVEAAKRRISDAVLGLALILGTYLILNAVNPELANFSALRIRLVKQELFPVTDFTDEAISTSGSAVDPEAKGKPSISSEVKMAADCGGIVDIRKAYKEEKPVGLNGKFYSKGCKKAWDMLKKAGAIIDAKGCVIVNGTGWGRTGMQQLEYGIIQRGAKLSSKCHIYYGCPVSMGYAWCSLEKNEDTACATAANRCWWIGPKTPDPNHKPYCDVTTLIHTEAVDAWAAEKGSTSTCGMDNVKCAKHRCQRELIRAWTSLGGGLLTNNADPRARPIRWESWHLCMSGCTRDADAAFAKWGL